MQINPGPSGINTNSTVVPREETLSAKKKEESLRASKRKLHLAAGRDIRRRNLNIETPAELLALDRSAQPKTLIKPRGKDDKIAVDEIAVITPYQPSLDVPDPNEPRADSSLIKDYTKVWPKFPVDPDLNNRRFYQNHPQRDAERLLRFDKLTAGD